MSIVRVAIPLYRGKRRFHLEKGRQWSIVEHLVLSAVAQKPHSVASLAELGNMHPRLVIEMLIRLMRAGWIELQTTPAEISFTASQAGIAAAAKSELPHLPRPVARWMNFVVDRVTGTVFQPREMPFLHPRAVEERAQAERIVYLPPRDVQGVFEVQDLIDHLFREDERFVAMDAGGDRLMERLALITVRNGTIEGLPDRAPPDLSEAILAAAASATPSGSVATIEIAAPAPSLRAAPPARQVNLAPDDLVVGGSENLDALLQLVNQSREKVVIHSTFLTEAAFARLKPTLLEAARRGARIDLLWGEGDDPRSTGRTRAAVQQVRKSLQDSGEDEFIRLQPYSTRSHAKFAIGDRQGGSPAALIGSCNWLSSDMKLVEASVRLREPAIVSDILFQAAELSRGRDGHWSELTSELAAYAARYRSTAEASSAATATAQLILGTAHKPLLVKATKAASKRIFVTSHRIAPAARQAVLLPLAARRPAEVDLIYGANPGPRDPAWDAIAEGIDLSGVKVTPPNDPAIHAKLLAWDGDDIVITSQNWLSADPSDANPRREIGVHLHSPGIADALATRVFATQSKQTKSAS